MYGKGGYWISPEGEFFEIIEHFDEIRAYPRRFGFTEAQAAKWKREDREDVIRRAIMRGWIRYRGYRDFHAFTVDEMSPDTIFRIGEFLRHIKAWPDSRIEIAELRHASVYTDTAEWIMSEKALAVARNPNKRKTTQKRRRKS